MTKRLLSTDAFRAAARAGEASGARVFRASAAEGEPEAGSRKIRFCFSDDSIDRMGDTIDPEGWDLADFNSNPVALWAHDSSEPPIGRASNVVVEGGRLMGDIEFATVEEYPFADTIYRLVVGKYINAVSVGFIPLEWSWVEDKDRPYGIDFKRQSLLEISLCPIPANPNALAEARAKGIDIEPVRAWAEKMLQADGAAILPQKRLDAILRLPEDFRATAKKLPTNAKGASGQLLRCANIAERAIKGEDEPEPVIAPAGTPRRDQARRYLELIRRP